MRNFFQRHFLTDRRFSVRFKIMNLLTYDALRMELISIQSDLTMLESMIDPKSSSLRRRVARARRSVETIFKL